MKDDSYEDWIQSQLSKLDLTKAICPHCGNDDPNLMRENYHFTHAHHEALNYQCHNRPKCDKYFQIGPLSDCLCGWTKNKAAEFLKEMLEVISERTSNNEPIIGQDHYGTVNWLLKLEPKIKKIVDES